MIRVCIVRQHYYSETRNLRRNAEALVRNGYRVDVVCQRARGEKGCEIINGVNVRRLPLKHHRGRIQQYLLDYTMFFLLAFFTLAFRSSRQRYDVVEVETMPDFLVFATLVPRLLGSRVILYMFENIPWLFASTFNLSARHPGVRLLRLVSKLSALYAHRVIVSDGVHHKRYVEDLGIPSKKITLVYNVPDENSFLIEQPTFPINDGAFRILALSSMLPRYGLETVIKALPRIATHIPGVELDLVGDGESRSALEGLATSLRVEKHVKFMGRVPYAEVAQYVAIADVAVAPMVADVGLPNKIFDYFCLSKPCVVSGLPSLRMALDEDTVSFFSPGNDVELAERVIELYRDTAKRSAMAAKGNAFYKDRRWSLMQAEYLRVYAECLAP